MDILLSLDENMVLKKQTYNRITKEQILAGEARLKIQFSRIHKTNPKVVHITSLMNKTYEPVKNNTVIVPTYFNGANKIAVVVLISENGETKQSNKIEIEIEQ